MKSRPTYRTSLLAIALLCIYLLNPIKLSLPFLEYQANYEFIVRFLCENKDKPQMHCNGKCFLVKAQKNNQEKGSNPQRINSKNYFSEELSFELVVLINHYRTTCNAASPYTATSQAVFPDKSTPPPKSLV